MDTVAKFNLLDDSSGSHSPAGQQRQTQQPSILAKDVVSFNNATNNQYDIKEPCDESLAALEPLDLTLDMLLSAQLDAHQQYQLDKLHRQIAHWVFSDKRSAATEQRIEQAFDQVDALMTHAYQSLGTTEKAKVDAVQAKIDAWYQGESELVNPELGFYPV